MKEPTVARVARINPKKPAIDGTSYGITNEVGKLADAKLITFLVAASTNGTHTAINP